MAVAQKIKAFLDENHIGYQILQHSLAYTAMESAGAQHLPGKQVIKSVIVQANDQYIMCVLPSCYLINFDKLKKITGAKKISLAPEMEVERLFPDYEKGAEPPFGNQYGLKVYVDRTVSENDEIVFNAGTHTDSIKMKYEDFIGLTDATTADFSIHI